MLKNIVADTSASVRFLSRLPLPSDGADNSPDFQKSAHTFPLAGMIIALPSAALLWFTTSTGLPASASAICAIALMILITGALHEDGLADMADGFWGGHTKARKLEIMRDSTIGTYGVLALLISTALRISLVALLIHSAGALSASLILLATAGLSRLGILQVWNALPAARDAPADTTSDNGKIESGLSARYGGANFETFQRGAVFAIPAFLLVLLMSGWWSAVVALVLWQVAILSIIRLSQRHIGGHTGDTLGGTQQLCELGLLLGLVWTM